MGDTVDGLIVDRYDGAELADVCGGGLMRGGVLLVGGLASAGKSTLAAELGAIVAATLGGPVYWLDRDQRTPRSSTRRLRGPDRHGAAGDRPGARS